MLQAFGLNLEELFFVFFVQGAPEGPRGLQRAFFIGIFEEALKGPHKALSGPYKALKGLIRPLRAFEGLIRPFKGLTRPSSTFFGSCILAFCKKHFLVS